MKYSNSSSYKRFVHRLDWGTEGVLKKLMLLWNNGVYPIGMNEIMESHSVQRISAATAFFSIMGEWLNNFSFLNDLVNQIIC